MFKKKRPIIYHIEKPKPLILKAKHMMRKEEIESEEKYYSEKLCREVIIIDAKYETGTLPPIK